MSGAPAWHRPAAYLAYARSAGRGVRGSGALAQFACACIWLVGCPGPSTEGDAGSADADVAADIGCGDQVCDPLSMPMTKSLDVHQFRSATLCKDCHLQQFEDWSRSRHAFAMVDPVFRKLVSLRQAHAGGKQDRFCVQCHSTIGSRGGEIGPGFSFDELSPVVLEGVTCEACHKTTALVRDHNAGHLLDPAAEIGGNLAAPQSSTFHGHRSAKHLQTADFCGSCHDVREVNGLPLERPFDEWRSSPAASLGKPCQACHMPTYSGPAATGAPPRQGLHSHRFVGIEPPLGAALPAGLPALDAGARAAIDADIQALLASAAGIELLPPPLARPGEVMVVGVVVENRIAGHSLPTGSTFLRQCWVELVIKDSAGVALYRSGDLDAKGDLRDHWSELDPYGDADLVSLSSQLIDAAGNPTPFPWRAKEHRSAALLAGHVRGAHYFPTLPPTTKGALTIEARLRFRAYPPWLLRLLGLGTLVDELPIHDLATAATVVDVAAP